MMPYAAYGLGLIVVIGVGTFLMQILLQSSSSSERIEDAKSSFKKELGLRSNSLLRSSDHQNLSRSSLDHLHDHHDINIDGIDDTVTATVQCKTTKGGEFSHTIALLII
jgi:hypothetical protein